MTQSTPPTYDSANRKVTVFSEIRELLRYRYLITQLVKRDVTARYKRSVLGVGWTLLDPILTMAVMVTVYSAMLRGRIEGFPVFILSGLVVWNFFSQASSQAMMGLLHGRSLIGFVYMPKSAMGVAAVGSGVVNLGASVLVLPVLMLIFGRPFTWALAFVPVALLLVAAFTLGVGLLVSAWAAFFADIEGIYRFVLRLTMYLSGIFYTVDILPEPLQRVVQLLPTYHLVNLVREPIYAGRLPSWETLLHSGLWSGVMFVIGFWVFTRRANEYAYRI